MDYIAAAEANLQALLIGIYHGLCEVAKHVSVCWRFSTPSERLQSYSPDCSWDVRSLPLNIFSELTIEITKCCTFQPGFLMFSSCFHQHLEWGNPLIPNRKVYEPLADRATQRKG